MVTDTVGVVVSEGSNGNKGDWSDIIEATIRQKKVDALRASRPLRMKRYRQIVEMPTIDVIRMLDEMTRRDTSDIGGYYYAFRVRRFAIRELRERARRQSW